MGSTKSVADESGGGLGEVASTADLDRALVAIVFQIHHQYLIGFLPAALATAKCTTLVVRTTVAGAKVRARKSYIASEAPDR